MVDRLRTWSAVLPQNVNLEKFSAGDYNCSTEDRKSIAAQISKVLYPEDNTYNGKKLRLMQEYFLVGATLQYAIKDFKRVYGTDMSQLPEKVAFHMKDTIEAQELVKEHSHHPIAPCHLVGPIAYDLIMSKEAARLKGYDCPVCGEFDGIVVPSLLAGNLVVKCWQMHAHAQTCGVVIGAKVPVALASRSDAKEVSFHSLAFCAALGQRF